MRVEIDLLNSKPALGSSNSANFEHARLFEQVRVLVDEILPGSQIEHFESPADRLASCAIANSLPIRAWVRTEEGTLVEVIVTIASLTR